MKNKHILINLTDAEYSMIQRIAEAERRSIAEVTRLILIDNASVLYNSYYTSSDFKKAVFIPPYKDGDK